jgi:hypothetical protein
VDNKTMNTENKIVDIVDKQTGDDGQLDFVSNSGNKDKYNYKETVLNKTGEEGGNKKTAYKVNGILMNRNEAGNVLWGATAAKVGIMYQVAAMGGQGFSILFERKLDEKGEQQAIKMGYGVYKVNEIINLGK